MDVAETQVWSAHAPAPCLAALPQFSIYPHAEAQPAAPPAGSHPQLAQLNQVLPLLLTAL